MKFGVREICEVVLRAKAKMTVGSKTFYKNEPVLYFDSLTTSSLEGAATTVYAQGGRGNARLLAWEGERTLTFNMTDALISPESFAVLSGAEVLDAKDNAMYVHTTARAVVEKEGERVVIKLKDAAVWNHAGEMNADDVPEGYTPAEYKAGADIFIMKVEGNDMSEPAIPYDKGVAIKDGKTEIECYAFAVGSTVLVDYYTKQTKGKQIEITPDKFGGYFYLEASTLFRDEATGQDLPAEFVIPRCKVQSSFTFTMAGTGDPSTFDFVLDAFPDYTKFDTTKKVLAILQVVEETDADDSDTQERAHVKKADLPTGNTENPEHKTRYGEAGSATGYAIDDDNIASEDFKLGTTVDVTADIPDTAITADFGKSVSNIQTGVTVANGIISGTSKYVEDFVEFSSNPAEQQGNYLVLKADVDGADTVTVQVKRTANEKPAVTLDDDRLIILLLTPETTIKNIEVIGKKDGEIVGKKNYTLNLVYESA